MAVEQRKDLLRVLARIDQLEAFAEEIKSPMYADVAVLADELAELMADMRAKVEQHLDHVS